MSSGERRASPFRRINLAWRIARTVVQSRQLSRDTIQQGLKRALRLEIARGDTQDDLRLFGFTEDAARQLVFGMDRALRRRERTPAAYHRLAHMAEEGRFDPPGFFESEDD